MLTRYNTITGQTKHHKASEYLALTTGGFKQADALTEEEWASVNWFPYGGKRGLAEGYSADGWKAVEDEGVWYREPTSSTKLPDPGMEELHKTKSVEIRGGAEAILQPFKVEYGATEIATWDQQYAEAVAFVADETVATPLLSAICTARGMLVSELASKVIANRAAWVALSGDVIGQRLHFQDLLDAATTVDEINAITPSYTLPQ